jgi:hypothetical protein
MRTLPLFALFASFALSLSAVACSGEDPSAAAPVDAPDQSTEQDLTATRSQLSGGAWAATDGSTRSYTFKTNGTFSREVPRILNGVLINGAPHPTRTETGRYSLSTAKKRLTLYPEGGDKEVYAFDYTPQRILNGVFVQGHTPDTRPTLVLTLQPAPLSHVAYPSETYKQNP